MNLRALAPLLLLSHLCFAYVCVVYFTGIGCPNCAVTDPIIFGEWINELEDLVIIEYEVYAIPENGRVADVYVSNYGTMPLIPQLLFSRERILIGREKVKNALDLIKSMKENPCPLPSGLSVSFEELDPGLLPGSPKIWARGKYIDPKGMGRELIRELIESENPLDVLRERGIKYERLDRFEVPISHATIKFENAVRVGEGIVAWHEPMVKEEGEQGGIVKEEEGRNTSLLLFIVPILILLALLSLTIWKKRF